MEEEAESLLRQLGLSEYETKACMVLVRFGNSDANKISSVGSIPLPRVYDTMENLSKKGLVSISRTRPQTFSIINIRNFFDILKVDEKRKIDEKIKTIDEVSSKFLKAVSNLPQVKYEESNNTTLTFTKRSANIEEVWNQIQGDTKSEFLVFAGDVSWINRRAAEIKKLTGKKIVYRIIWFKGIKEVVPNIKKAVKSGAELRFFNDDSNELRGIISDTNKIYLIQKMAKPGISVETRQGALWNEDVANYNGTLITSKTIAKVFRSYFYFLWQKSMPAEDFLKKFK
ncbi:MAG: helix-turn-helix domain-containing protein [Candidatus Aenigmatarchaeota archaeon]